MEKFRSTLIATTSRQVKKKKQKGSWKTMKIKKTVLVGMGTVILLSGAVSASAASFKDVKQNAWYASAISWAENTGIVAGYPDHTFHPNAPVTEAEFVTMLLKSYPSISIPKTQWPQNVFTTAKSFNYPVQASNRPVSRLHVAELVAASQGVLYQGREAEQYILQQGLANGKTGLLTIKGYAGFDTLTRAEAAQFIKTLVTKGLRTPTPAVAPTEQLTQVTDTQVIGTPHPAPSPAPSRSSDLSIEQMLQQLNDSVYDTKPTLPADPATQPVVDAFVKSLKVVGDKVTGKLPTASQGYTWTINYVLGNQYTAWGSGDGKKGQDFSIPLNANGITLGIFDNRENGVNGVSVKFPSMKVVYDAKQ
ncbi:S-layer homology domain-containing protein [Aneurinibacillus sp. Ricciae_BoGa-3]|uniref:S-layer homology domain-containing protein n=1 Tax=Aneurinibacillus sp. Ricciae_BoGa-3 TaxID=3022697 RepID=UPI00234148D2|nr:S-layer homology domain-containing protein [Aneurinibacillus sp. Ricciae_BoGa-3]WCK53910.1 S-layer homology domain-containing protein [Aneurinibacillus sp. Ricciae_BoGa-3]